MSKFIPVSGPLVSTDSSIDALDNVRVGGVSGYYPALQDGDVIFVVTPDEETNTYRVETRSPRPPQDVPRVIYPKYNTGTVPYTGNICFILAGASSTGGTGTSGTSGTSGVGTSGSSGSSGTSAPGITSGSSGSSGTSGIGEAGTSGSSGTSGLSGTSGTSGEQGDTGTSGTSGSSGTGGGPGSSGALKLGLPTDGDWSSGIGGFTENTSVADAIDNHDEILALIAPTRPGLLTSQVLTLSGTTRYSAKLPSGLGTDWYKDGSSAGATISDYVVDNTFRLTSPSPTTSFYNGSYNAPSGTLELMRDTASIDSISTSSTGSSTLLTVSDVSVYNSIWSKANAYADVTQVNEGHRGYTFKHTLAGESNLLSVRYDDVHAAPSFAVAPVITEGTVSWKWLSGIQYYGSGTTLNISFTADNLFNKCYHPSQVASITMSPAAFSVQNLNPGSIPAYTDQLVLSSYTLTLSQAVSSNAAYIRTTLYKPEGATSYSDAYLTSGVCTYGTVSTTTADSFYDEAQRVVPGTLTVWTSTVSLTNGQAQVRNGTLQYPDTSEYPGFTGDQEYQRMIVKSSASTGSLTLNNITYTQISPYGTGDLNVLLQLDTDGQYFDLGRVVGDNNGTGSGDSRSNSKGARSSGSGATVSWSFGIYSTYNNDNRYRLIIIFRTSTRIITSLVGA